MGMCEPRTRIHGETLPYSLSAPGEHAHLAVLAGEARTARKYFEQLGGKVDLCCRESRAEFVRRAVWAYSN